MSSTDSLTSGWPPFNGMDGLRWSLFSPGDRVLVAISGGPDSLSLLHALYAGRRRNTGWQAWKRRIWITGCAGTNRRRRRPGWRSGAAERGIPCHVGQSQTRQVWPRTRKRSKQEAARAARYAFLEEAAARVRATKIATGHTRDDQVETVLFHILRGTGLDGLRGIPAVRGLFVRPLLDVSRMEIEAYCVQHGLTPRRDPSNLSADAYTRNRVRLELLPQLGARL